MKAGAAALALVAAGAAIAALLLVVRKPEPASVQPTEPLPAGPRTSERTPFAAPPPARPRPPSAPSAAPAPATIDHAAGAEILPPGADPEGAAARGPGIFIPEDAVAPVDRARIARALIGLRDTFQRDEAGLAQGTVEAAALSEDLRRAGGAIRPLLLGTVVVETAQARIVLAPDHQELRAP